MINNDSKPWPEQMKPFKDSSVGPPNNTMWVVDTETTGFTPESGDRILEIGCIELVDRVPTGRRIHEYIDPEMDVPESAYKVHGISRDDAISLGDGQKFTHIAKSIYDALSGTTLIIHNASFDMSFLDAEFEKEGFPPLSSSVRIIDTLKLANSKYPRQRNNLDALCKRLGVDNTMRGDHGALLDAELLLDVYLLMSINQNNLSFNAKKEPMVNLKSSVNFTPIDHPDVMSLPVIYPADMEIENHNSLLSRIKKESGGEAFAPAL